MLQEVTGSSGSCTGNAATATNATTAENLTGLIRAGDGSIITTAEELNYRDREANAAVTDADDVSAAGAVMISTAETITGAKTFDAATILNSTLDVGGNSVIVDTGNVSIGINNPSSLLHLKQTDTDGHCLIKIEADGGSGSTPYL